MVVKVREIEVPPGSELARFINETNASHVVLVKDGVRYRLERESGETSVDTDDQPVAGMEDDEAILSTFVGAWTDVDADALIEELRRAREEGSRPFDQAPILR